MIKGAIMVTGSWITITTEQGGKSCFKCDSPYGATNWQAQLNLRITEAKGTTLRTKKVYEDALARLKKGPSSTKST